MTGTEKELPALPGCGRPATVLVEAYSPARGRMHGLLDACVYVCAEHDQATADALAAAGFTPYRMPIPGGRGKRCGKGFDYRAMRGLTTKSFGGNEGGPAQATRAPGGAKEPTNRRKEPVNDSTATTSRPEDMRVTRARDTLKMYENSELSRANLGYEGERLLDVVTDLLAFVDEAWADADEHVAELEQMVRRMQQRAYEAGRRDG